MDLRSMNAPLMVQGAEGQAGSSQGESGLRPVLFRSCSNA